MCLHDCLSRLTDVVLLSVGRDADPRLAWDISENKLFLNGSEIAPRAVFVRRDVFSREHSTRFEVEERAHAWFAAVTGWLEANPDVRCVNRPSLSRVLWKPAVLRLARETLPVPRTLVTNDVFSAREFIAGEPKIAKPIDGGDYCKRLGSVLQHTNWRTDGAAPSPALVQEELTGPELRVYGIGGRFFAFWIRSNELDYRVDPNVSIEFTDQVPADITQGLGGLMRSLGLDFCAADFKTCPTTKRLLFLEVNDAPMFAFFDAAAGGRIVGAIADLLLAGGTPSS